MKKTKRRTRTSMRSISVTGKPAPSWTPDDSFTKLANECYRACLSPYAKPDLIRVFRNNGTFADGRCYIDQRILVVRRESRDPLHTLAHEIAHLRYCSHGPRHAELTEKLHQWILAQGVE